VQEETKAKTAAAARPAPPPIPAAAAKATDALIDRVLQPAPQQEEVKTSGKEAKPSPRAPAPAASPAAATDDAESEAAAAAGMADVTQSELAGLTMIASGSGPRCIPPRVSRPQSPLTVGCGTGSSSTAAVATDDDKDVEMTPVAETKRSASRRLALSVPWLGLL
jgi:hypothetical protein